MDPYWWLYMAIGLLLGAGLGYSIGYEYIYWRCFRDIESEYQQELIEQRGRPVTLNKIPCGVSYRLTCRLAPTSSGIKLALAERYTDKSCIVISLPPELESKLPNVGRCFARHQSEGIVRVLIDDKPPRSIQQPVPPTVENNPGKPNGEIEIMPSLPILPDLETIRRSSTPKVRSGKNRDPKSPKNGRRRPKADRH